MIQRTIGLLALVASAPFVAAQGEDIPPPVAPQFEAQLTEWQASHGQNWRALLDATTGQLELLYGGNARPPFTPDTAVDGDWFALARHWVAATHGLHGIELGELTDDRVVYLPLGMANSTDKLTVRLRQSVLGLPVENGVVNALFDTSGRLLSLHSTAAPLTDSIVLAPALSGRAAVKIAQQRFEQQLGLPAMGLGAPLLQIAQVTERGLREAKLAYRVEVRNDPLPAAKAYIIDANTGLVLRVDELIHDFDVTGQIRSNATPGTEADHGGNPPTDMPMSYINVSSSNGGTVQTDRDGNFTFVGENNPIDVTVEYNGTFNNVNNQGAGDYSITFTNVLPGQPNTLLMNPTPGEQRTAQANAFQHVNVLRDYIRDTVPSDNTADFKAISKPNISSTCNAFFDGGSVNYYKAGGGCNNTAFTTVIAHEMGHWLNVKYGTGNGSDGMGEGNGDVFAMYTYDDPVVGRFFSTGGGFVRTGNNTRQFCGDGNGGCYGGVHADGEVWMGAAWKVRRNLKNTLGTGLGGATADQLFVGWMNAYNQSQIKSIIETQWLTLDDDDGDIGNGTPNHGDIDGGFLEQGFPGHQLDFFTWANVTDLPDVSTDVGPYTVSADVVATLNPPVQSVDLNYTIDDGATQVVVMNPAGNTWSGDIPALGGVGIVRYWLTATDSSANSGDHPAGDPFGFTVGDETILYEFDFEAAGDQGWEGHLASDTATTGHWERGDPRGTAAQSENDHTPGAGNVNCWFTGQGSAGGSLGENDVDNGITTLLSPTFDLTGSSSVLVSYWRWYSNDTGSGPNADVFLVQLSNDDGGTWTTVETVGPSGDQASGGWFEGSFTADAVMPLTSTMRVQFIAEDKPNQGSIVEAAVDDFKISTLSPGCPAPVNYCTTSPNSAGPGATMAWAGSQDVIDDNFTIATIGAPAGEFGLFFYGPVQDNVAFGEGTLCVDSSAIFRLPVVQVSNFGDAFTTLGFGGLPTGGEIVNGDTVNFSFWFRDPTGGPSGFNFADGLEVTFCGN